MNRSFKIILVIASVVLAVSITTCVLSLVLLNGGTGQNTVDTLGYGEVADPTDLTNSEKIAGYATVLDYGAKPDDNTDDTAAFEAAIKKNIAVYVPAGRYIVSRPLPFNDQNFFGDGEAATVIVSLINDATKPIVYLGGSSTLSDMTLEYSQELICGQEKKGERVAVMCGAAVGFGPGGGIRDASFRNVGTAVCSDASDGYGTSNCNFERINLDGFTYCGFDFNCLAGYGNVFSQISASASTGTGVFVFQGSGGTDLVQNLVVKGCKLEYAIGYTELSGVTADNPLCNESEFSQAAIYKIETE